MDTRVQPEYDGRKMKAPAHTVPDLIRDLVAKRPQPTYVSRRQLGRGGARIEAVFLFLLTAQGHASIPICLLQARGRTFIPSTFGVKGRASIPLSPVGRGLG